MWHTEMGATMRYFLCVSMGLAVAGVVTSSASAATCTLIKNLTQLQHIQDNLTGSYCLANDIDASTKPNFKPIAASGFFSGTLDGVELAEGHGVMESHTALW